MPIVSTGKESGMGALKALVSRLKSLVIARSHLALENLAVPGKNSIRANRKERCLTNDAVRQESGTV